MKLREPKQPKNFTCAHCGEVLGLRRNNEFSAPPKFSTEFKKSQPLKCEKCQRFTKFEVERRATAKIT